LAGSRDGAVNWWTGVPTPVGPTDATPKSYVDTLAAGLAWKQSVVVASTANVPIATGLVAGQVVDGIALTAGDRVLLKNQTAGTENGIYVSPAAGAATRATDSDTGLELEAAAVFVQRGTANANNAWTCTTDGIVIGTTAITWVNFAIAIGVLIAGSNLSDLGNAALARGNLGLATVAASGLASDLAGTLATAQLPAAATLAAYLGSAVAVAGAALGDASATLTVAGGNCYTLPAATPLTAARVLTLGVGGTPLTGEVITVIRLGLGAFTLTLQDDAGTVLTVLPASTKAIASGRWNGTHFADAAVQRVA
jgi:hypothetical protein